MRQVKVSYHELDVKKRHNLTKVQYLFPKDARVPWKSHVLFEFVDLEEMLDVVCAPPFNKQRSLIKRAQIDKSTCKWYQKGVILLEDIFWSLRDLRLEELIHVDHTCKDASTYNRAGFMKMLQQMVETPGWRFYKSLRTNQSSIARRSDPWPL